MPEKKCDMIFDYHMHTHLSDGKNTHEEMVVAALEKGIQEIGFSDHFCIKQPCGWALGKDELGLMVEKISQVREQFDGEISIRYGVEVDYFPDMEDEIAAALKPYDFDYVIGSVHFLDDWNYDSSREGYDRYSNDYLYQWYFKILQQAAASGLFNYMAHPDLIKKFEVWPDTSQKELYVQTAKVFAKSGVVYEVNTSGKDRPCGEFFPNREFLEELFSAGVPVTLGSDSHKREQLGRHFQEAKELLKEIGYTKLSRFDKKNRIEVSI